MLLEMWFCAWMIIGGKQSPLGNIATYQPGYGYTQIFPTKLCVTQLWREERGNKEFNGCGNSFQSRSSLNGEARIRGHVGAQGALDPP